MMKIKNKFWLIALILTLVPSACRHSKPQIANKGVMDLREWNLDENGNVYLQGEWEFYWQNLIPPQDFLSANANLPAPLYVEVPSSSWTSVKNAPADISAHGYATYHVKLLLPPTKKERVLTLKLRDVATAYRIYVDGKFLTESGQVGQDENTSKPQYHHILKSFKANGESLDITVHVSNFHYSKAGLWDKAFLLGLPESIYREKFIFIAYDFFLFGALFIMAFYYLTLFSMMHKERAYLFFGIFTLIFSLRILVRGEMLLLLFFPNFPFSLQIQLEYLSFYLSPVLFYWFMRSAFPKSFSKRLALTFVAISSLFMAVVIFTSPNIFTRTIVYYQLFTLLIILATFIGLVRGVYKKEAGILPSILGVFLFGLMAINDMLFLNNLSPIPEISPLGVFILIVSQALMLAFRYSYSLETTQNLVQYLEKLYRANARFVPKTAVQFLEKTTVIDVHLGDNVQKDMSILFCDIRNFTQMSESMHPQDTFDFLNHYFSNVSPQIRNNQGFVDKYLGDGIMALFPESADTALKAAIEIQKKIQEHNIDRSIKNRIPLSAGIGLHKGMLLLGTLGEEERFNIAVISENVDITYRLERLTKMFGMPLIISEEVKNALTEEYSLRKVGAIQNHSRVVFIYEVLDVYDEEQLRMRLQTHEDFEKALQSFADKNYDLAQDLFKKVLAKDKDDKAALYHLNRARLESQDGFFEI